MSIIRLVFVITFLSITFITTSKAQNISQCVPSLCGEIGEIKFPFRLRTDPQHCGEPGYELDCQNNQTVFNYKSRKFYVQEINYRTYSIRLLDPGLKDQQENCTALPDHRASYDAMTSLIFQWVNVNNNINYVSCLNPINSSRYIATSFCTKNGKAPSSNFTYLVIGEILRESDLAQGCRVETVAWSSAPGISSNGSSLSTTHQGLAYGFGLSWRHSYLCRECEAGRYPSTCILEENSDIATCKTYCYEDTPLSELPFRCTVEYYSGNYTQASFKKFVKHSMFLTCFMVSSFATMAVFVLAYGGIGIAGLLAIRFLLGIPILIAVVVWQCKRRNLNTSNEENC